MVSKIKKFAAIVPLVLFSLSAVAVFAQDQLDNFTIVKPDSALANIPALIGFAIQILFIVAGLVAFVYLLLGGIKWITSGGDKGQVEAARNQIVQALIGLIVVFAAWGLIVLVEKLFSICLGFSCALSFPSPMDLKSPPN